MLDTFFAINLPYGIGCNKEGEWMAFNREYLPLGYFDQSLKRPGNPRDSFNELPIYTRYQGLTESFLLSLADDNDSVIRDEMGKIVTIFFYKDRTNPSHSKDVVLWNKYFDKLKNLSTKQISI